MRAFSKQRRIRAWRRATAVAVALGALGLATGTGADIASANVWNSRLSIRVDPNGQFSLGAIPNIVDGQSSTSSWKLTFGWPSAETSFTTVRVNGQSTRLDNLTTISPAQAVDAATNRGVWLHGAIQVTQVAQIVPNVQSGQADVAQITYVLANTSSVTQTVGLRMMVDTQVNSNDGAPFRVPGGSPITTERTYTGTAIPPAIDVFQSVSDTAHVATIQPVIGQVPPDKFALAAWPTIFDTLWDYTTTAGKSLTSDSAYAVWWNDRTLSPGEAITFTSAYGLGQLSADTTPPLSVGLSGPARLKFLNGGYSPNPFNFVGTIRNSSSVTALNVSVTLQLPPQLTLVNAVSTPLTVNLGSISPGNERQVSWNVRATLQQFDETVTYKMVVNSSNSGTKTVNRNLVLSGVPGVYVPIVPFRLVDSRVGTGVALAPVGSGEATSFVAAGIGAVPANARSVVLNVTGVGASAPTYITVWPNGDVRPTTSNLNLEPGDIAPNLVIAKVGAGGRVAIFNFNGRVDVVVDVMGYFLDPASGPGVRQRGLSPARLVDTRIGTGAPVAPIQTGGTLSFGVLNVGGVPADATAVILNVTGVQPAVGGGFMTVWPTGAAQPLASNLNLKPGETRPNIVIAKVGDGGRVSVYNQAGPAHLVVDVLGYFSTSVGAGQVGILPQRALDTRDGTGLPGPTSIGPGGVVTFRAAGLGAVPDYASTVVLNVTAVGPTGPSFLTVWPTGEIRPLASNLNTDIGVTIPNHVIAKVGAGGSVSIYNNSGNVHVVVDVMGYFA